jgi:predicted dehydrogenase
MGLKVGVAGVGHLGAHHARIYTRLPGVALAGVHDRDPERARAVAAEVGCKAYASLAALAGELEALSVAVPAAAHAEVAIPSLERGVAVLVEKPMAASVAEAEAIRAAARSSGAPLMVGHVERWNGAFRRVRPLIDRPRFIEGHRLSSFAGRGLDVDVIFDLMIHDLDLVASLTPAALSRVAAVGVPVLTASADIANVRLEFEDGLVANLTASRVSRERMRKLRIFQANAYVSIDFAARSAERVTLRPEAARALGGGRGPAAAAALLAALEHTVIDARDDPEPLVAELAAFVEAVRDGRPPAPGADEGLRAVELAERVAAEMASAAIESRR